MTHRVIGVMAMVLCCAAAAGAQDRTCASLLQGQWLLDEGRSDPPMMGARSPRSTRIEATSVSVDLTGSDVEVGRRSGAQTVQRAFSGLSGQRRVQGAVTTLCSPLADGAVLESWEEVALPGGHDTLYERQAWTVDALGTLTVRSELRTRLGQQQHRAVYRRARP